MKIRFGSSPSSAVFASRVLSKASPRVTRGRVVRKVPPPIPHLPPVHFFAEADVPAGGEATLRSEALSNRTGKPVEIHEIRVAGRIEAQSTFDEVNVGSFLGVQMTAMGHRITNAFVPMWLLGKTEQENSQIISGTEAIGMYVWRLSHPMYLSPDAPITAQFQHTGAVRFSARAQIALAGRYVANRQTTSKIPFATSFVSRPFSYDETEFDESSERDLMNVLGKSANIDRLIGRVLLSYSASGGVSHVVDSDSYGGSLLNLRVFNSNNLPIIRDYQNVQAVFGYSRAIDVPHVMEPNDFLHVGVRKTAGATLATPYTTWNGQVALSMLGWREERI